MIECPYCDKEVNDDCREWKESGYDVGSYWDKYIAECPHCGKQFSWYENYVRIEDDTERMEE